MHSQEAMSAGHIEQGLGRPLQAGVESRESREALPAAMARENLLSLFHEFRRFGSRVAVVERRGYRREPWTYRRLAGLAVSLAQRLRAEGVRTGDRVILWGPASARWMAAFWACLLRGAVAVPMDDGASPDFVGRVARDTQARLVFSSASKPEVAGVAALRLEDLADTSPGRGFPEIPADLADAPIGRGHMAEILFTSGTTAEPRGVVLTHGNFLANLEPLERGIGPYRKYLGWFGPLRFVSLVPPSHVFGQFMTLLVPPLLGAAVVLEASSNPGEIIRTVRRERATAVVAVPRMLDALRGSIEREAEARGRGKWFARAFEKAAGQRFLGRAWRFRAIHARLGWKFWAFISGGAALAGETEQFLKRLGYAVAQGYGMTETASLIALNHPFRAAEGSIGKILPGREFRLAEDGEILVRGETVSEGYWERGAICGREKDGWLATGDLGEMDQEGNLRFRGRKKNVIVTAAGLNIHPEDLEAALRRQEAVRDAVIVPETRGENAEPCAVLLLREGREPSAGQAVEAANAGLAEFQRMRRFVVWPDADFPRTPTGKPRLGRIAEEVRGMLAGRESRHRRSRLEDLLPGFAGGGALDLERELDLSSLDRVELLGALEETYQVELDEQAFADAKTVAEVERLLERPAARRAGFAYPRWAQREPVRWLRLAVYYALVWPATWILARPGIVGRENLLGTRGPLLVVSNHITRRADIGLILAGLPRGLRHRLATAMGGESLERMRRPPAAWFFLKRLAYQAGYWLAAALFTVFPLPQFSGFRESFRFAGEAVDRGYSVLLFPEGEVNNSADGRMARFAPGVGLLAGNLGLPVVPMRLDGVWQMKREGRRLARRGEITVRIGKPVTFPAGTPAEEIAGRLEDLVREL